MVLAVADWSLLLWGEVIWGPTGSLSWDWGVEWVMMTHFLRVPGPHLFPSPFIHVSSCLHSFRPALPVSFVQGELAFEGEAACRAFLAPLGLGYMGPDNTSIDCRLSVAQLPTF